MKLPIARRRFWFALSLMTTTLIAVLLLYSAPSQLAGQAPAPSSSFRGQVVSGTGSLVVGGPANNPGHPVTGAIVYLVPIAAIDTTSRMTASAIYAAPFPAEAYDEPLEDAIRIYGKDFPQSLTDARGNFSIANVPDGKFFIHVTPGLTDTQHLPGGDQSRRSVAALQ